MKPIIVIINDYGYINGGTAQVAITSAIELAKQGERVVFFCGVGPIDDNLKKAVEEVICLDLFDILNNPNKIESLFCGIWNIKAYSSLYSYLLKNNKEIKAIHIHGWIKCLTASVIAACRDLNFKPFITMHDYFSICPNGGLYNFQKQKACFYEPMSFKCLICNCDSRCYMHKIWRCLRQCIQNKWIKNNDYIIPIFISNFSKKIIKPLLISKQSKLLYNPTSIINPFIVDSYNNDTFIYIGRISPEKGVDLLCEAIKKLQYKCIVIGDGPLKTDLENKYPFIEFVGWKNLSEIESYIRKAKALVFPSKCYETFGLTVLEALVHGLPCIVPDSSAACEFIDNQVNGLLFKTGNIDSLVEVLRKCKNLDYSNDLWHSEKWPKKHCNKKEHVIKLIEIYTQQGKQG